MALENGFYANTEKLHDLQAEVTEEARVAQRLLEELKRAYRLSEAIGDHRLNKPMQNMEKIARYCDRKRHYVDEMCSELEQLSLNIGTVIEESSETALRLFRNIDILTDL